MKILTLSGSTRTDSANIQLLRALSTIIPDRQLAYVENITELPVFTTNKDKSPWSPAVHSWRNAIKDADAVIISTPEYLYNLPAKLKNALEWLSTSGELQQKPVLAITFTPHPPRGEKAMQSLLWSLQALNARIVGQLPLYQHEIKIENGEIIAKEEIIEMLKEAIGLLG